MTTAVLGAAGFVGLNLVDALLKHGVVPRCVRRRKSNVLELRRRRVPMVHADLEQPGELAAAFAGVKTLFHAAGHYPRYSLNGPQSMAIGVRQLTHVLDAAAAAGVERLVYVSSTATVAKAPGRASSEHDVYEHAPLHGPYHTLKWAMEQLALNERRLEVRVACPSACLGPYDSKVGTSALLVALARSVCPPHPDGHVSWVDARDVAEGLVRLMFDPLAPKRVILSAETTQLHALLERLALRYDVARPPAAVPAAEAVAFADAEEREAQATGRRARLSREIVDLVVHGAPLDTSLARQALGLTFRPLEQTLEAFDAWAKKALILPSPYKEPAWKRPQISTPAS
jgi:dihydroflavonol-4-reductase